MKLSTRSRYGARILLELARNYGKEPVPVSRLSRIQEIPPKYMEQLVRTMKKAKLITSIRGPKGGHALAQDPQRITLGQIVRLFETQTEIVECISTPDRCDMAEKCRVRRVWKAASDALYKELDGVSLAELIAGSDQGPLKC